jgi:Zn-dependent M16 (insulinase) family peptidase
MASYAITAGAIEHYADALAQFEHLLGRLTGEEAQRATHGELEALVQVEGSELLRRLIQGHLVHRRDTFVVRLKEQLARQRAELERLKERQVERLELAMSRSEQAPVFKDHRRAERRQGNDRIFDDYEHWIENSLTTEREPYLQVIAALTGIG